MSQDEHDIRTNYTYLPPRAEQLPVPGMYALLKNGKTRAWTTGYPAWCLQYYSCLCSLKRDRPNVIIETGTNNGLSTAVLVQTLVETNLEGHVHTFEINPKCCEKAREIWDRLNLQSYITLHEGDSVEQLKLFLERYDEVHFAFIDSDHSTRHCMEEVAHLLPAVVKGEGKFYFDNTAAGPVDEAIFKLKKEGGIYGWVDFPNCSGCPNGQAIWQPWVKTETTPYYNSRARP